MGLDPGKRGRIRPDQWLEVLGFWVTTFISNLSSKVPIAIVEIWV